MLKFTKSDMVQLLTNQINNFKNDVGSGDYNYGQDDGPHTIQRTHAKTMVQHCPTSAPKQLQNSTYIEYQVFGEYAKNDVGSRDFNYKQNNIVEIEKLQVIQSDCSGGYTPSVSHKLDMVTMFEKLKNQYSAAKARQSTTIGEVFDRYAILDTCGSQWNTWREPQSHSYADYDDARKTTYHERRQSGQHIISSSRKLKRENIRKRLQMKQKQSNVQSISHSGKSPKVASAHNTSYDNSNSVNNLFDPYTITDKTRPQWTTRREPTCSLYTKTEPRIVPTPPEDPMVELYMDIHEERMEGLAYSLEIADMCLDGTNAQCSNVSKAIHNASSNVNIVHNLWDTYDIADKSGPQWTTRREPTCPLYVKTEPRIVPIPPEDPMVELYMDIHEERMEGFAYSLEIADMSLDDTNSSVSMVY